MLTLTCSHSHAHTLILPHTHTLTHTLIHTHTSTHSHTLSHSHTHTHTHTAASGPLLCGCAHPTSAHLGPQPAASSLLLLRENSQSPEVQPRGQALLEAPEQ
ncbi:hypothetical protein H1C71_040330 [Ictidomys tridecemlineatus]|nr:hypothetical protein H1C71_040330 [Ictidomys tridecemlineatus]